MNLDPDPVTANTYVAGLAGAILGLKAIPGKTFMERLANLLCGFLLAFFVGSAVVEYLHVTPGSRIASGLIFAVGAGGLVVFAAIIDGIKQTQFGAIISGWLSRNRST